MSLFLLWLKFVPQNYVVHLFLQHESEETDEASKKAVQIIVVKFSNYSTDHADRDSFENRVNMAQSLTCKKL